MSEILDHYKNWQPGDPTRPDNYPTDWHALTEAVGVLARGLELAALEFGEMRDSVSVILGILDAELDGHEDEE